MSKFRRGAHADSSPALGIVMAERYVFAGTTALRRTLRRHCLARLKIEPATIDDGTGQWRRGKGKSPHREHGIKQSPPHTSCRALGKL